MATKRTFHEHPLIDYSKLVANEKDELRRLENEFKSNGWCFVELPNDNGELTKTLRGATEQLYNFFQQSPKAKNEFQSSNAFGYTRVGHKEGIKVLTDVFGPTDHHHHLPADIGLTLLPLSGLLRKFTNAIDLTFTDLPTFKKSPSQNSVPMSPLTMLDIVYYYNQRTGPSQQPHVGLNTDEVNCVPHFDPGLFSLSILSTTEGLQLKDRSNDTWIDGPVNKPSDERHIGVIWLGEAAALLTNGRFQPGIHRVVYPQTSAKPRLTIWQEVCTWSQVNQLTNPEQHETVLPHGSEVRLVNQPDSKPYPVHSTGETRTGLMKRIEFDRGISLSKVDPSHFEIHKPSYLSANDDEEGNETEEDPPIYAQYPGQKLLLKKPDHRRKDDDVHPVVAKITEDFERKYISKLKPTYSNETDAQLPSDPFPLLQNGAMIRKPRPDNIPSKLTKEVKLPQPYPADSMVMKSKPVAASKATALKTKK